MAALTITEVETAIQTVLKHQKYRLLDREYTFANLDELRKLRQELLGESVAASSSSWGVARFGRPSQ
jgi:hypothetical protein